MKKIILALFATMLSMHAPCMAASNPSEDWNALSFEEKSARMAIYVMAYSNGCMASIDYSLAISAKVAPNPEYVSLYEQTINNMCNSLTMFEMTDTKTDKMVKGVFFVDELYKTDEYKNIPHVFMLDAAFRYVFSDRPKERIEEFLKVISLWVDADTGIGLELLNKNARDLMGQ